MEIFLCEPSERLRFVHRAAGMQQTSERKAGPIVAGISLKKKNPPSKN